MADRQIKKKRKFYSDQYGDDGKHIKKKKKTSSEKKNQKDIQAIKKMCEYKTKVTTIAVPMIPAGNVEMLCDVIQGTGIGQRVGSKVKSFSLRSSGVLQLLANKGPISARIAVFIDFSQQGIIPAISDLWQSDADFYNGKPRNLVAGHSTSFKRLINIYDEHFILNLGGIGVDSLDVKQSAPENVKVHDHYQRVNHYVYYKGTSNTIAEQRQGTMFVMSAASVSSSVSAFVDFVWKYTDK